MNINLLIDAIVRQTTILIAQLATSAGARTPLAKTANQVFMDLVRELKAQGVGNKVIADMFGMALRTYHDKVVRLSESSTYGGKSLWAAVLGFIQDKKVVARAAVLERFSRDDEASVKGVLRDLVESELVFQSGRGDAITYRAATPDDRVSDDPKKREEDLAILVLVAVNRYPNATVDEIAEAVPIAIKDAERALERLSQDGRVKATETDGVRRYECASCVIPLGAAAGWEAAVFDHYQALVTALCTKLRQGKTSAELGDRVGGSTYGFDVWDGHPMRDEVLGFLADVRKKAMDLRARVEAHNAGRKAPESVERVITYVGQTVLRDEGDEED